MVCLFIGRFVNNGWSQCTVPTGLSGSVPTTTSINFNWTAVPGATKYQVRYREVGTTAVSYISWPTTNSASASVTAGSYEFSVRADCGSWAFSPYIAVGNDGGSNDGGGSDGGGNDGSGTSCGVPANPTITHNSATSITMSWDNMGAQGYQLSYRKVGTAAWTYTGWLTTTSSTKTVAEGSYEFRVRANCSNTGGLVTAFTVIASSDSGGDDSSSNDGSQDSAGNDSNGTSLWSETGTNIHFDSKVIVGPSTVAVPSVYGLYVKDGILTEKAKIALRNTASWSDYVFEEDYKRNSIEEMEKFIKKNKHLPNVPSAQEVFEQGIDVATMDATLLRQIEELWLHMIEMKKENE